MMHIWSSLLQDATLLNKLEALSLQLQLRLRFGR